MTPSKKKTFSKTITKKFNSKRKEKKVKILYRQAAGKDNCFRGPLWPFKLLESIQLL